MVAAPIGQRIRIGRQKLGLTQTALAERVGISPSYLNLIEHNRRSIGGALLHRIAAALGLDSRALAGTEESRLIAELAEIGAERTLRDLALTLDDAREIVAVAPKAARTILALYRAYRDALNRADLLAERLGESSFLGDAGQQIVSLVTAIRSFSGILNDYGDLSESERRHFVGTLSEDSERLARLAAATFDFVGGRGPRGPRLAPAEEVEDFFTDKANYFPALEEAAAALHAGLAEHDGISTRRMIRYLAEEHGIATVRAPAGAGAMRGDPGREGRRALLIPAALPPASLRFRLARAIGESQCGHLFEALVAAAALGTDDARRRCRHALSNYVAAALLMPYDSFLEAAVTLRHDIELLESRFEASFEQVCHRLTTLRRPQAQGIPLHFLRVDVAGNISKRFSASGLRLPRYGGPCPRWIVHAAFLTPGRIVRQMAVLPDGERYLFIARAEQKQAPFGLPRTGHAVMIGCRAGDAGSFVYADGLATDATAIPVPVGISCPQCPRDDCDQRAFERVMFDAPSGTAGHDTGKAEL